MLELGNVCPATITIVVNERYIRIAMNTPARKTGIGVVGDIPWGTHFFLFYETKEDLLDSLVPYFKAGLEGGEFCMWVISHPLTEDEVRRRCAGRFATSTTTCAGAV